MRKTLIISIDSKWITVENALSKLRILESVITSTMAAKLIFVVGVMDNGYESAGIIKNDVPESELLEEINEQAKRYFQICKALNLNSNSLGLFGAIDEAKCAVLSTRNFRTMRSHKVLEQYAIITRQIYSGFLATMRPSVISWPETVLAAKSLRDPEINYKKTKTALTSFRKGTSRKPDTHLLVAACAYTLSGVPIILPAKNIPTITKLVGEVCNVKKPITIDSFHQAIAQNSGPVGTEVLA